MSLDALFMIANAAELEGSSIRSNRPVAFVDLDNCISDDKWRWPLFQLHLPIINERYQQYHEACDRDIHENRNVIHELAPRYDLIAATSRPEAVRHKTRKWLDKWNVPVAAVLMRPNDDHRPSTVIKREMLALARQFGLDVQFAMDDRSDILDMYADEGVRIVRRVFIHSVENIHP